MGMEDLWFKRRYRDALKSNGESEADRRAFAAIQGSPSRPRLCVVLHDQIERHVGNESTWRVVRNHIEMVIGMLPRQSLNRLCFR
jgi:hypothetical protein